jgi:hypothetical protein
VSFSIIPCDQRSPAWYQARCGRLTGSMAHCVTAKGKGSEALTRRDYRYRLACERIAGEPIVDEFVSADMRRGINLEANAIAAYQSATQLSVEITGFIADDKRLIGCSLDGHIGQFECILEVKCCKASLHVLHWHTREEFVREHWPQIAHGLWVTGAAAAELVSFNPQVPAALRLLRVLVLRQDAQLDEYIDQAEWFLEDVDATVREVQALAEATA